MHWIWITPICLMAGCIVSIWLILSYLIGPDDSERHSNRDSGRKR